MLPIGTTHLLNHLTVGQLSSCVEGCLFYSGLFLNRIFEVLGSEVNPHTKHRRALHDTFLLGFADMGWDDEQQMKPLLKIEASSRGLQSAAQASDLHN